ncbi:MAG: type II toxin-antitoxin system RelE/ParE family toxin [Nitrococcus sp.]|nr:type II toxin-antitoxin system RelE/ParE family toxin [Nitrococcus sp.]
MPVRRVRFVVAARREFLAQVIHYNEEEPGLGARFTKAVEEATARALAFPFADSPATEDTRRVLLKDFPFAVVYRQDANGITVFALAHHARRPDYWQPRTRDR